MSVYPQSNPGPSDLLTSSFVCTSRHMFYLVLNIFFNYVVLGLYLSIVLFSNISVMEGLVSDVCVTYTTAGQLTQLRGSTRGCPILYVVSDMATVCVDRSSAMFNHRLLHVQI